MEKMIPVETIPGMGVKQNDLKYDTFGILLRTF
jgi:hypothetical protein